MTRTTSSPKPDKARFKIIATGGTIDKGYSPDSAELFVDGSFFGAIADELRLDAAWELTELLRKDSLEITDHDRALILREIVNSTAGNVIVTHGTDSMVESAEYIDTNLPITHRAATIVFTGSFIPGRFTCAESSFNLGAAFAASASLPSGVYITLGGRIHKSGAVTKDYASQRFLEA